MKLSVPLMLLAALAVAGCSRPVVRETVIESPTVVEKPVVVEKQVVVERPVVATTPPASCSYNATAFNHGSYACQLGNQYRCTNGAWDSTGLRC